MYHFKVLQNMKVNQLEPETKAELDRPMTPVRLLKKDEEGQETNISNQWRIYAKMEGNFHLTVSHSANSIWFRTYS